MEKDLTAENPAQTEVKKEMSPAMSEQDIKISNHNNKAREERTNTGSSIKLMKSDKPEVNFSNAMNEMLQICEYHQLQPPEVNAIMGQIQYRAMQKEMAGTVNQMVAQFNQANATVQDEVTDREQPDRAEVRVGDSADAVEATREQEAVMTEDTQTAVSE